MLFVVCDIIVDNKGIFIEYGGLEVCIWVYVDIYDWVYLVCVVVSIKGKK